MTEDNEVPIHGGDYEEALRLLRTAVKLLETMDDRGDRSCCGRKPSASHDPNCQRVHFLRKAGNFLKPH